MNNLQPTNQEIIRLLAEGKTVKEVAHVLAVKPETVTKRIQRMKALHRCLSVTQLVVRVLRLEVAFMTSDS